MRFSREEVIDIRKKNMAGITVTDLAKAYNAPRSTIYDVCMLRTYKDVLMPRRYTKTGRVILSKEDVISICGMIMEGVKQKAIVERFGVTPVAISDINCGKAHKELTSSIGFIPRSQCRKPRKTLSTDDIVVICRMLENGDTNSDIADRFGVSWNVIYNIKLGKNHADVSRSIGFSTKKGKKGGSVVKRGMSGFFKHVWGFLSTPLW